MTTTKDRYRITDSPTNGTSGQDCGVFEYASLPARIRAAVDADPTATEWSLPALADGDTGAELDDLLTIVRRTERN